MKMSIHQRNKIDKMKTEAVTLYKQGLTSRRVGEMLGRSHVWVINAVNEAEKLGEKVSTG